MNGRIYWALGLVVGISSQLAAGAQPADFHLTLQSQWMWGPVSGYLQTPSGGQPGTSTRRRPSFEELGIDTASIFDWEIRPGLGDHELYFGGQWIRFSEDATLDDDLISQSQSFPAGTRVSSDIKLDNYFAGYRYRIQRGDEVGVELPVEIHSRVGVGILDFHYQLDRAGAGDVDRAYVKLGPEGGVEMEWHAKRWFSIDGEFTSTLPFKGTPWILEAQVVGRFKLLEKGKAGLDAYVGGGYEHISFYDSQQVRNHISANFGPMLILGVELRF